MSLTDAQMILVATLKNSVHESGVDAGQVPNEFIVEVCKTAGIKAAWTLLDNFLFSEQPRTYNLDPLFSGEGLDKIKPAKRALAPLKSIGAFKKFEAPKTNSEVVEDTRGEAKTVRNISDAAGVGHFIPALNAKFVPYGPMGDVKKIIKSQQFLPTYIFGETGLAKSLSVSQLSAQTGREVLRINVNVTTDEEDFIGSFRLIDGETVFQKGVLINAMERGAILLIDELSALNPAHAFSLFAALEGEPVFIKKTNEIVTPRAGFNIIATDNTKGKGSTTGQYVGVNVQNNAFLDRFLVAVEYVHPTPGQELKILNLVHAHSESNMDLIKWANVVRSSHKEGIIDESMSTRRLCSILQVNAIFGNMKKAIEMSIARYEGETKSVLLDLFEKVVADPEYGNVEFDVVPEDSDSDSEESKEVTV